VLPSPFGMGRSLTAISAAVIRHMAHTCHDAARTAKVKKASQLDPVSSTKQARLGKRLASVMLG